MIVTNDILPSNRRGLITGSRVSVLFPKKSSEVGQRSYAKQLANEMYFGYYDNTSTWQTEHGNLNENQAELHYKHFFGEIGERPEFICDEPNQLGGSPDWVGLDYGIDWKCPTSLNHWLDYLHEGIDEQQYYQAQMYMALTGKKLWKVCAFLTETTKMIDFGIEYPVPMEQRMIVTDVKLEEDFHERLLIRAPKVIQMRNEFLNKLHDAFSGRDGTEEERRESVAFDDHEPNI